MKINTIPQIVKTVKKIDIESAVNESMISELIATGCIPYEKRGNRTVTVFDSTIMCLNRILGLGNHAKTPHIRTIRGAVKDLKQQRNNLGISESLIREAVQNSFIDTIRIGNRAYIALEFFEEPYVRRFTKMNIEHAERQSKAISSAADQIGSLIANSQGMPAVKRVRK